VEQAKKDIEKADPFEPRLKPIIADEKIQMSGKVLQSSWVIRLEGDKAEYVDERGKTFCHGVVVVRSLIWPGAFTLYQNGKQTSVYVGWQMGEHHGVDQAEACSDTRCGEMRKRSQQSGPEKNVAGRCNRQVKALQQPECEQ